MQIAFFILAVIAALKAQQAQPQLTIVPADEPLIEAALTEG